MYRNQQGIGLMAAIFLVVVVSVFVASRLHAWSKLRAKNLPNT